MLGDFVMSTHHPTPDACIACTTCVVNCPVARATPNYLGPRLIGPAYERFRLLGLDEEKSLHYCSNCKNCDISCPHGVPVSTFNMMARADYCRTHKPALRDWVLGHGELLAKLLRPLPAGLKNFGMLNPLTRKVLDKIGIAAEAPLPAFAPARFRDRLAGTYQGMQPRKVALFPGCFIDIYDPQTGFNLVWLLNRAGYEVIIPKEFSCCGLPMIANGFANDAKANAKRNLRAMRRMQEQGIPVISSCPSCVLMLNQDVPEFFPDLAQTCTPHVLDAQAFLLDCVERGELLLEPQSDFAERVVYHAPCHLRAQGGGLPGYELLRQLPNIHVENADAGCCGISGSYGFKKEKYAIGMEVGAPLFDRVRRSGAGLSSSECGTCRLQLTHGTRKPSVHPVTLLRRTLEKTA